MRQMESGHTPGLFYSLPGMARDETETGQVLNITNGGAAADNLRRAGLPGDILTWDDMLHEGPVPELPLETLSGERARFIHACAGDDAATLLQRFHERDEKLRDQARYARILLWFEHDLYDQLQLIQLLAFFHEQSGVIGRLGLINPDRYLGMLEPSVLRALLREERSITPAQLELASRAWSAFREPTHESLQKLLREDLDDLPWLRMALLRLLEEYPACNDGLSRTERQLLEELLADEAELSDPDRSFWEQVGVIRLRPHLDRLKELSRLPAMVDYRGWKSQLLACYESETPYEDWWQLPGGRMLHVVAEQRPDGGVGDLTSPRRAHEVDVHVVDADAGGLDHLDRLRGHVGPDAVAADHCNAVRHRAASLGSTCAPQKCPTRVRMTSARPPRWRIRATRRHRGVPGDSGPSSQI